MLSVIVGVLAVVAVVLTPTVTWLIYTVVKSMRAQLSIRDILDSQKKLTDQYQHDRDVSVTEHAVTKDELAKEKDLRIAAEKARDEAYKNAREDIVKIIEQSGVADAVVLGNRILSAPLPALSAGTDASAGDTDLEKP